MRGKTHTINKQERGGGKRDRESEVETERWREKLKGVKSYKETRGENETETQTERNAMEEARDPDRHTD